MNTQKLRISVGLFVLVGLAAIALLAVSMGKGRLVLPENTRVLLARFTNANGLKAGSPVQIAGGATLDLNGTSQQVPSVSNISGMGGTITNSVATPATFADYSCGSIRQESGLQAPKDDMLNTLVVTS